MKFGCPKNAPEGELMTAASLAGSVRDRLFENQHYFRAAGENIAGLFRRTLVEKIFVRTAGLDTPAWALVDEAQLENALLDGVR
jgi:hypothetical protein